MTHKKWQELIRQQEQSKPSVTAFCREHGVSDQSFYTWRKRLATKSHRASPLEQRRRNRGNGLQDVLLTTRERPV